MTPINCKCGFIIKEGAYPSTTKGILFSEKNEEHFMDSCDMSFDSYISAIRNNKEQVWFNSYKKNSSGPDISIDYVALDILNSLQTKLSRQVYECSNCGRIHIANKGDNEEYQCFKPESGKYNATLDE